MDGKSQKIKKNVVSSIVCQVVIISLNFLLPRLQIDIFGSEVNGILTTVKQIFGYLILLETGIGLATTHALYAKMGDNDHAGTSRVLAATHKYYTKTGFIYLAMVLLIAVFYSFIIPNNSIDSGELFFIIILMALPSVFSYFVQVKYRLLMEVDGRNYVLNTSETVMHLLANIGKVLVLVFSKNLIVFQLVYCTISLAQLVFIYLYAKRKYTWLDLKAEPDFNSISQKNSVLLHKLSGMVFSNTDTILISVMCGFTSSSVYIVYNIFFSQMQTLISSIASGFNFALGQMFNTDREQFNKVYNVYETMYIMATFTIYTLMAVFLLPVIQIYTAGVNDAEYTNVMLVFLFVIMNLLANGKLPINSIIEYSGKFRETQTHAVWEMIINISVSVAAIYFFGICGAIVGTIAALIYRCIVTINYSNKKVLGRRVFATYKRWLVNGGVFAVVMAVFFVDTFSNMSLFKLVLCGIIHSLWIVPLYIAANYISDRESFRIFFSMLKGKNKA